jgi:hypothetical protein
MAEIIDIAEKPSNLSIEGHLGMASVAVKKIHSFLETITFPELSVN